MNTEFELKVINASDFGLEPIEGNEIETAFEPDRTQAQMLVSEFNEISKLEISLETAEKADELIKKLVPIRTSIARVHKVQKAYFWQGGKMVDAIKNRDTMFIQVMEDAMKLKRDYYKNIQVEKLRVLIEERTSKLEAVRFDVTTIDKSIIENNITFDAILRKATNEYNIAIENEKKEEQERLDRIEAEKERIEAQRVENIRLKKEAEVQRVKRAKEIAEADKKAKVLENKRKKEAEVQRVKDDKLAKIAFDKSEKERIAREKIQNELNIAKQKEENRLKQIEIENQLKLSAGDSDKQKMLVSELEKLKLTTFKSTANKDKMKEAKSLFERLIQIFSI